MKYPAPARTGMSAINSLGPIFAATPVEVAMVASVLAVRDIVLGSAKLLLKEVKLLPPAAEVDVGAREQPILAVPDWIT
jgi:hypothetical protein